jgi:accessory gene regulator B
VLLACFVKFTLIKIPAVILYIIIAMSILRSYTIIVRYSPVDSSSKPIRESDRENFRKKSIKTLNILVLIAVILLLRKIYFNLSVSIIIGLLWQSLTLVKIGETILNGLDIFLEKLKI